MQSVSSGPLVFWRETGKGRRGLACHVQFCDNPECACQEAFVQAFEVDERFHSIASRGETVELRHIGGDAEPPSRKVSAVIDLESGGFLKNREETRGETELLEWLRDALDDEALSRLRSSWSSFALYGASPKPREFLTYAELLEGFSAYERSFKPATFSK